MEDVFVYDKAKYHYDGEYPEGLPEEQAFVHTGMFLGWIIDNDLCSEEFKNEAKDQIEAFKGREITGADVYAHWDGCLLSDMLSDQGNKFAEAYYLGEYLDDYDELLTAELPSIYQAENTWENYEKIKRRIDQRYKEFTQ